jgi:hypothetical protein
MTRVLRVEAAQVLVLLSVYGVGVMGGGSEMYSIGTSDMLHLIGAVFHSYENAWSVDMESQQGEEHVVLFFALCKQPCSQDESADHWQEDRYFMLDCGAVVESLNGPPWHNAYVAAQALDASSRSAFCDGVRSDSRQAQQLASNILSDASGGALVRLRPPLSMVVFNEPAVLQEYTAPVDVNSSDVLSLTFRISQLAAVGDKFAVRHAVNTLRLHTPAQRLLTLALRNSCTAIGLSAPAFGNVRSVEVGGRPRCVWECRGDMLREPYNSQPPTRAQLDPESLEYANLPIKYACVELPTAWVATVFAFTVDIPVQPTDVGYSQALFDVVDRLTVVVMQDLSVKGKQGVLVFSIKNSVYHSSFDERLRELQTASCVTAGVSAAQCEEAVATARNLNYAYETRRLLRRRVLLDSQNIPLEIEGLFIYSQSEVVQQPAQVQEQLVSLQTSLSDAVIKHAPFLTDDTGVPLLSNIADIDFEKVVSFITPSPPPPPAPVQNVTESESAALAYEGRGIGAVNIAMIVLAGAFFGLIILVALIMRYEHQHETRVLKK